MIRGLDDLRKKEENKSKRTNDYYAGGERSGLAVSSPDDVNSIVNQARQQSESSSSERKENEITITITLYSNGFTLDDGPFRDYNAPENQRFMSELNQGRVPQEVYQKTQGKPVAVNLADKRQEEYVPPPPPPYIAFSGEGQTINSTVSEVSEPVNPNTGEPNYDPNQPTTTVQVRFHNGERKNVTMNTNSPVAVLFEYVMSAAPVDGSFELVTGFPPKPLSDPGQSIQDAGVAGAAVIQKLV